MTPVIVVGGGIGGLSLALALARRGIQSTVLDQAPTLDAVGAGLQLGPNAVKILDRWGLRKALREQAVAPLRAEVRDAATGRSLLVNRLGAHAEARWDAPYLVLTRAALQAILLDAVLASGRVELRLGEAITSVRSEADRALAALETGHEVEGEALFGCDGLRSVVRAAVSPPEPPRFTGQTAWRGLATMAAGGDPLVQVWTGPHRHFVRYPVGQGRVNVVAVVEAKAAGPESWTAEGQAAELAAAFADWPEPVRATIAATARPWRSALYDRAPLDRWTRGRISLLGDAAHSMLPFLAQGAAMAIEDAEIAARRLGEGGDRAAALCAYEADRRPRTAKAQAWSSRNARLFHLPPMLASGVFGAAGAFDRLRAAEPEARFDWLYGWTP
jgi:salicylate hydroxylase